jgi:hypothetical protein
MFDTVLSFLKRYGDLEADSSFQGQIRHFKAGVIMLDAAVMSSKRVHCLEVKVVVPRPRSLPLTQHGRS